jgi:hypothetical protein
MKAAQLEVAIQAAAGFDFLEKLNLTSFCYWTDKRTLKMEFLSGGIRTYTTLTTLGLLAGSQGRAYNLPMAKSSSEPFEVGCPCCNAVLKVDPETKAVLSHVAAVKPKMFNDFEAAARAMREQEGRKESIFRQAVDAQKNNASLLEKKFQEAVKKAKETPDEGRPLRDFDLD